MGALGTIRGVTDFLPMAMGGILGLAGHSVAVSVAERTPAARYATKAGGGAMIALGSWMMTQRGMTRRIGSGVGSMGMIMVLMGLLDLFVPPAAEDDAMEAIRGIIPIGRAA